MKLIVWVKLCVMRTGRTFVHWPARDVREDILIVDTSRFDQNLVGVRRRTYNTLGLYRKKLPPPDYPNEIEWLSFLRIWWGGYNSRGHCIRCNYDLTGNVSGVCPECGTPVVGKVRA